MGMENEPSFLQGEVSFLQGELQEAQWQPYAANRMLQYLRGDADRRRRAATAGPPPPGKGGGGRIGAEIKKYKHFESTFKVDPRLNETLEDGPVPTYNRCRASSANNALTDCSDGLRCLFNDRTFAASSPHASDPCPQEWNDMAGTEHGDQRPSHGLLPGATFCAAGFLFLLNRKQGGVYRE